MDKSATVQQCFQEADVSSAKTFSATGWRPEYNSRQLFRE